MANPKHKLSRARRDKRRANKSLCIPAYSICPECHEPKWPHRICTHCGSYKGRSVITVKEI
ncbi:MAG: 50S ribosomal protein L32 [Nitrospirota bacterium]